MLNYYFGQISPTILFCLNLVIVVDFYKMM